MFCLFYLFIGYLVAYLNSKTNGFSLRDRTLAELYIMRAFKIERFLSDFPRPLKYNNWCIYLPNKNILIVLDNISISAEYKKKIVDYSIF